MAATRGDTKSPQRLAAVRARAERARTAVISSRDRHPTVAVAFELSAHDVATGGNVLAGAIAYRLFLWTLPAALLTVGILGANSEEATSAAEQVGLGKAAAASVGAAASQAHRARWTLIVIGAVLLLSVSRTLAVTLHTATALSWRAPVTRLPGLFRTALVATGVMCAGVFLLGATSWLRHHSAGLGLTAILLSSVCWAAGWWGVSALLPHPPLPWWGLLPGAALVGVAAELLQLVSVLYLTPRLSRAAALYGSLGTAATLLIGAYLIARVAIGSIALDAAVRNWSTTNRAPHCPPATTPPGAGRQPVSSPAGDANDDRADGS